MSGSGELNNGPNMTSVYLNGSSDKINNNENPNFSSSILSQALNNACIVVPAVCFVGTVVVVFLGLTICKMNKTCDRCPCIRLFQERQADLTEDDPPCRNRVLWRTRGLPPENNTRNREGNEPLQSYVPVAEGVSNPLFDYSSPCTRTAVSETMSVKTFNAFGQGAGLNNSSEYNLSDTSKIVNCSGSGILELSPTSSSNMYHERIKNFLTDPLLIFHKTYNPAIASVLHNREPESNSLNRNNLETLNGSGSETLDMFTVETLNTFREDSSFSEYHVNPVDVSYSLDEHSFSDLSKIVNYDPSSTRSSESSLQVGIENAPIGPIHLLHLGEQQVIDRRFSNEGLDSPQSSDTTFMRVPPPSPNTNDSMNFAQNEDIIYLNENPWLVSTRRTVGVQEETQGSWTTAQGAESRDQSLEWDNYQPQLLNNSGSAETPGTWV